MNDRAAKLRNFETYRARRVAQARADGEIKNACGLGFTKIRPRPLRHVGCEHLPLDQCNRWRNS